MAYYVGSNVSKGVLNFWKVMDIFQSSPQTKAQQDAHNGCIYAVWGLHGNLQGIMTVSFIMWDVITQVHEIAEDELEAGKKSCCTFALPLWLFFHHVLNVHFIMSQISIHKIIWRFYVEGWLPSLLKILLDIEA